MPIGIELFRDGTTCYDANLQVLPIEYTTSMKSKLIECYEKVIDDIYSHESRWQCNWGNELDFRYFDV